MLAVSGAALLWVPPTAGAAAGCEGLFPGFSCDEWEARPEGHVAPMSMPFLFEDPYITTGLNFVGVYRNCPDDSIFDGGGVRILVSQERLAITDGLAFIATKDGFAILRPDQDLLNDKEGFLDVTLGFKCAVIDDRETALIVTSSLRYEIPLASNDIVQETGDGVLIPAVSVGCGPGDIHLIADFGAQVAMDGDSDSSSIFYNIHLDQAFPVDFIPGSDYIVPSIEMNGMIWVDGGDGSSTIDIDGPGRVTVRQAQDLLPGGERFEAADVANPGSSGVAGESLIAMAWGIRVPFRNGILAGFSYERVLSREEGIFEQRATGMVAYEF